MIWSDPADSDKHYWHRYSRFYQRHFEALGSVSSILEYGVFKGDSIRWLRRLFPVADIVGVDILPPQPEWPTGAGISYVRADQGDRDGIADVLRALHRDIDLVIEDGSHLPRHQAICLAETFRRVRPGGLYVLEDLHTSHPRHGYYQESCAPGTADSLHLLLWIEHLRATGKPLRPEQVDRLAASGLFTAADVRELEAMIGSVEIYHRAALPLRCYACGGDDFDPVALVCRCGVGLDFMDCNSITAVLRRAPTTS